MTIYYLRTGGIHKIPPEKESEIIKFYKLFKNRQGMWQNGRGDIYAWED